MLELTHKHGTESVPNLPGCVNGNAVPGRGLSHITNTVDGVGKACERFGKLGVAFNKKLDDGQMKYITFILDHDGWVESRVVSCILALTVCLIRYLVESIPVVAVVIFSSGQEMKLSRPLLLIL
jgi:hypothetical protein